MQAIVLAVNKMDLVDWDEGEFDRVVKELDEYVDGAADARCRSSPFPISALLGDNVVDALGATRRGTTARRCCTWLEQFDIAERSPWRRRGSTCSG